MKTKQCNIKWHTHVLHSEVSGSCILLSIEFPNKEKRQIIIDCGMFQEFDVEYNYSLPFNPQNINYVFLTHNHNDHCGRLPYLVSKGYTNNIYCTKITKEMLRLSLNDSARIASQTSSYLSKRKGKYISPLYTTKDVSNTLGRVITFEYNETNILEENISVTFLGNNHMLGAACILIQLSYNKAKTISLLFTGDYKKDSELHDVPEFPKWVYNLEPIIFQESTYGDSTSDEIIKNYDEDIISLTKNNYTILHPVIACERVEQILLRLKTLQEQGKIDNKIPIYLDGTLAIDYLLLYLKYLSIDFIPENLHLIASEEKFYELKRNNDIAKYNIIVEGKINDSVLNSQNAKIILSTSGMADFGNARYYISRLAHREDAAIYFTCYTPLGTLGYKLKNMKKGKEFRLNVYGDIVVTELNATVLETSEFSSHARSDELIEFLNSFNSISGVFINHGEPSKKILYAEKVLTICNVDFVKVLNREIYYTLSGLELLKSSNSKFDTTNEVKNKIYSEPSKKRKEKLRKPRPYVPALNYYYRTLDK